MRVASHLAGALLGLVFLVFGSNFFLHFIPMQGGPPAGSPQAMLMGALVPTGYFAFIKVIEITGGLLVAIPKTRAVGLLFLGPVIVNILAFHVFLGKGAGLKDPVVMFISLAAAFLLFAERKAFGGLLRRR
jgi:putative oxidoreductase